MLDVMFEQQMALNTRCGVNMLDCKVSEEARQRWLLNYVRAMQQELGELTDCVPWKWWANYQVADWENAKTEVIDLFHFLISLAQVLGMSAEDVFARYQQKMDINNKRQDSGYTTKYTLEKVSVATQDAPNDVLYTIRKNGEVLYMTVVSTEEELDLSDLCSMRMSERLQVHVAECPVCKEAYSNEYTECPVYMEILTDCICKEGQ